MIKINKIISQNLLIPFSLLFGLSSILFRENALVSLGFSFSMVVIVINSFLQKKFNKPNILVIFLIIPFLLSLMGLLWSGNLFNSLDYVLRISPILILPFLLMSINDQSKVGIAFKVIEMYFPLIVIIVFISYFLISFFLYYFNFGNYFFYSNFSEIYNIHTTSASLIFNVSLIFLIKSKKGFSSKTLYYCFFILHFIFLILISSKTSFIIFFIVLFYEVSKLNIFKNNFHTLLLIIFGLIFIFFITLENRFSSRKLNSNEKIKWTELVSNFYNNDINFRLLLWKSNIESLNNKTFYFGLGTNPSDKPRLKLYSKYQLNKAMKYKYNAHNQFIETYYSYGMFGVFFFFIHLGYMVFIVSKKDFYSILLLLLFIIYFFTESLLIHSRAIILYSFILVYLYYAKKSC
jgi:hypothetical protein